MDKKRILFPLAGLLLLASCGKEPGKPEREPRKEGYRRPNIVMENQASGAKVWMDENGYTYLNPDYDELSFNGIVTSLTAGYGDSPITIDEDILIPEDDYMIGFVYEFKESFTDYDDWELPQFYRLDLYPQGYPINVYYSRVHEYDRAPNEGWGIPLVSISKPYNQVYTSESVQSETVVFQHLCATIMLKCRNNMIFLDTNDNSYKLYEARLDSVCVTSDRYPLNGWREVRLNADCSVTIPDVPETTEDSRLSVSIIPYKKDFSYSTDWIPFAIPIPPVKAPSTLYFTFYCTLTKPGTTETSPLILERTATLNRDIVRNMQINATIDLNQELTGSVNLYANGTGLISTNDRTEGGSVWNY